MNPYEGLKRMRDELDQFAAQIPSLTHWSRYSSEPESPRWWYMDQTVTLAERGAIPVLEAWRRMVALLASYDLNDAIWVKCARRNMWVAAVGGGTWEYGDPRPELPALTLTATFHPLCSCGCGEEVAARGPNSWVVSDRRWGVLGECLRLMVQRPDSYDLSVLVNDPDAPELVRRWGGEFSISADLAVENSDEV